nr:cytochrome P450 [Agasicles hygrophila]
MWLILVVFILTIVYYLFEKQYSFWSKNGVPGPKPVFLVGNFGMNVLGRKSMGDVISDIYKKYENYPFVGVYKSTTPVLLVRDPEFVKNIVIRDFKHFYDNDIIIDKDVEPLFGRNPFCLKGQEWKQKRAQLSHCFTSGKIKGMYVFLEKNASRMIKYIKEETNASPTLELREVCIRFTLDNVAACAFGLEGKCFDEPLSQFRDIANRFLSPGSISAFKFTILSLCPWLGGYMKIKFVPNDVEQQLMNIVRSSIKYRKENNVVRNDFLDAMLQISSSTDVFTDIDIVANSASFFGDGYETSSRVMAFALFELALNVEVQEKLRKEIQNAAEKNNNILSYDVVNELPYLDACLNESLRKNSIIASLGKTCTEDYTYTTTDPDLKPLTVHVKAGSTIMIPIEALQNDPKYFENPDKYIPERFLEKNANSFNKYTFMPFGEGPRSCIGQRFGLTQIKVGIANIINNFKLTFNAKTKFPLKFDPHYIMLDAIGGLWVDFKKIN